jgi:hypothetical protein
MTKSSQHHPKPSLDVPKEKRAKADEAETPEYPNDTAKLPLKAFPVPMPTGVCPPKPTRKEEADWIKEVVESFQEHCLGKFIPSTLYIST